LERECGSCTACCVFLRKSREPGDLRLTACQYLKQDTFGFSGQGCSIYAQRFDVCKDFKCDYLLGKTDERPDHARNRWLADHKGPVPKFFGMMEED